MWILIIKISLPRPPVKLAMHTRNSPIPKEKTLTAYNHDVLLEERIREKYSAAA
jgi:hypothetical protein